MNCPRSLLSSQGLTSSQIPLRLLPHLYPCQYFHTVNPSVCPWSSLVSTIATSLGPSIRIVPWATWLSALHASREKGGIDQKPRVKLLDFYDAADQMGKAGLELPVLETEVTTLKSETLRRVGPIREEWMREWMKQWAF
jgi:hypothetical protein